MDQMLGTERKSDAAAAARAHDIQNPHVFVVGCGRSGTTLLQRMLDSHPQLAVANDTHFITGIYKSFNVGIDPTLTPRIVQAARNYQRFLNLRLADDDVDRAAARATTFAEFVTALYDEFARVSCKRLAGQKTPRYVNYLPLLNRLFPWVRFVHMIRDGRDVTLSALEWATERHKKGPAKFTLWRHEPVAACALWWRSQIERALRDSARMEASKYYQILYEDLVARPEEVLRGVTDHLGLPYASQMLDFHKGKERDDPKLSAKRAWKPVTPRLRSWRSQMAPRDVELFEALAGDLLSELGYARGARRISPGVAEVAERCRAEWAREGPMHRRAAAEGIGDLTRARPATRVTQTQGGSRKDEMPGFEGGADVAEPVRAGDIKNPYVFVVGCPRSGTTLLGRMLDSHSMLALADEPHFIADPLRGVARGVDPALTPELVEKACSFYRFRRLGLADDLVRQTARESATYSAFVGGLYTRFAAARDKPLAGEKAPLYVRFMPLLHGLFPSARFVHLFRDGRDVALSLAHWAQRKQKGPVAKYDLGLEEPIAVGALSWARRVRRGLRDGRRLGAAAYHEVRYEALVIQPEPILRGVSDFLGLPYDPGMMRFNDGKVRQKPGRSAKSAWLGPTPGLRDWRAQMLPRDVELFEALAGDLLSELGYERGATVITDEIAEVAERCRTWWRGEMARNDGARRRTASPERRT